MIVGVKPIEYRNKVRCIIQFENLEHLNVSNYWLYYKLKIKIDRIKTEPTKKKERASFCV